MRTDGQGQDAYLIHVVDGVEYRTKISTLRGDYSKPDGSTGNRLRLWEKSDFKPRPNDIFQERLYAFIGCVQEKGKELDYEFRTVIEDDLKREHIVEEYVAKHLAEWQDEGWIPDMRIEVGGPPRYQGLDLIRARGWMYWHHVFNPRQLLCFALLNRVLERHPLADSLSIFYAKTLDWNSLLCRWYSPLGEARERLLQSGAKHALQLWCSWICVSR